MDDLYWVRICGRCLDSDASYWKEQMECCRILRSCWRSSCVSVHSGPLSRGLMQCRIYGVRLSINTYFNYRLSNTQGHLNDLGRQREETIEKLKAATKYNSTQQLLEKYGGAAPKPSSQQQAGKRKASEPKRLPPSQGGRTGIAPPATANIPGRQQAAAPRGSTNGSRPQTPQRLDSRTQRRGTEMSTSEEFAPNAFSDSVPPAPTAPAMYAPDTHAVSYTHLTLPTKRIV